jgi:GntR family transcriptional repressor for pyruvate dehydrogenase complex
MEIPSIKKIKPIRLFERAMEEIGSYIIQCDLRPGDKLPSETELATMLNISRSSVREAMRGLESKGLIEVKNGAGAYVAPKTFAFIGSNETIAWLMKRKDFLIQLLQVRKEIEGLAVSLAAPIISNELIMELKNIVHDQDALPRNNESLNKLAELDARFHILLAKASGNMFVEVIVGAIAPTFYPSNQVVLTLSNHTDKLLEDHHRILNALESRNPVMAKNAISSHILRVMEDINMVHE